MSRHTGTLFCATGSAWLDDRSEAEDLVAEIFVVVWRRFDEIPVRDEELFWLYGIAAWVLSNIRRTHQRSNASRVSLNPGA